MSQTATGRSEPVVKVSGLGTRLGTQWILRNLDLSLARGETLVVIGESGGGKSMLLRQIIGLRKPDEGHIEVFGEPIHQLERRDVRRLSHRWGVLFQQGALFSALSVYDNIAFPMREMRKDGALVSEEMVEHLVRLKLEMVGLKPEVAAKSPAELSGGMLKRAALARALALDAEMLFLDEPTSGLDPVSAREFDALYLSLHRQLRMSAFIVSHNLETLTTLADRVAVLADGHIIAIGALAEVSRCDHPFIQQFFAPRRGIPGWPDEHTHRNGK